MFLRESTSLLCFRSALTEPETFAARSTGTGADEGGLVGGGSRRAHGLALEEEASLGSSRVFVLFGMVSVLPIARDLEIIFFAASFRFDDFWNLAEL